jgi:hypothetical protein
LPLIVVVVVGAPAPSMGGGVVVRARLAGPVAFPGLAILVLGID